MTNNINNEKQMPSQFFMLLLDFLKKEYNYNSEAFFKSKNINPKLLLEKGFSFTLLKELISDVLSIEKNYEVLYKLARLSTPSRLGILGYLMIHSKNVHEALDKLCKYYLLIGKKIKPVFIKSEDSYKIVIYFKDENGNLSDMDEYHVMIHLFAILHLINHIIPQNIKPTKVHFVQKEPAFTLENSEIMGIKTSFAQEENAIYFSEEITKFETISSNEHLLKVFEKEAEDALELKLNDSALKEKISGLILISSSQLDISLDSIALKAGLHPRVLQKRLKSEGSSFSQILLEVRKKLVVYYLSRDMEFSMISLNLGFIDLSSFFRAFKKWYGMTPKQYKEKKNLSS